MGFLDKVNSKQVHASTRNIKLPNRDGGILHITAGISNEWEPSDDEIRELTQLFVTASNSQDSIICTRHGIKAEFIPVPKDFWKSDKPFKVSADTDTIRYLMQALRQALGNKVYMREVEQALSRLELDANEQHSFRYLISDLKNIG